MMSIDAANNQLVELGEQGWGGESSIASVNSADQLQFERQLRASEGASASQSALELSRLNWSGLTANQLDNDPNVNKAELGEYIRNESGVDIAPDQLTILFDRLDHNGSGNIREKELDAFIKSHGDELFPAQSEGDSGNGSSNSPSNEVPDVEFFGYTTWRDDAREFDPDGAAYFVYVESHGNQGHGDIDESQKGFVSVEGADLVDYGGGRDKYIALFKVTDPDSVVVNANGGAAGVLFLDTDQTVDLHNARTVNPSVQNDRFEENVRGPENANEIVIYAEDEGGKRWGTDGLIRDDYFIPNSSHVWGQGKDDMVYMIEHGDLPPDNDEGPRGNGATGTLVFS